MIKKILWAAAVLSSLAMLIGAGAAFAQGAPGTGNSGGVTLPNPLDTNGQGCTLVCVTGRIIQLLLNIAVPIAAIMVLWGGFQMMTSTGDPEKFEKAQKTILYAAIGFAIVLLATSVVPLIKSILGAQ